MDTQCVYLEEARYAGGFRIFVRFNTGRVGEVDLSDIVYRHAAAAPLRDEATFRAFYLDDWPTLAWSCGFDVAPETLYERCEDPRNRIDVRPANLPQERRRGQPREVELESE